MMEEQSIEETLTTASPRLVNRVERVRRVADLSVSQLSLRELHAELQRRITQLQEQKRELLEKIDEIEHELTEIGGMTGAAADDGPEGANGRSGRRARNDVPLADMLADMLRDKPMTTREAADAALEAGYRTTSKNFVNSVGVALHRDERFTKEDGRWCTAGEISS